MTPGGAPGAPSGAAAPELDEARAASLLAEYWGVRGSLRPLGSHEDHNLRVDADAGTFVLKVTGPLSSAAEIEAQAVAMAALAAAGLPFATPSVVPCLDGTGAVSVDGGHARLLTWVDGVPMSARSYLAPPVLRALGGVAATAVTALADVAHPALDRAFTWDCRQAPAVVRALAPTVADLAGRAVLLDTADRVDQALAPVAGTLRLTTVHGDVTDLNVTTADGLDGRPAILGLIDLGDVSTGWLVAEAAVAGCSAVAHAPGRALQAVAEVVRGFDEVLPLHDDEVAALWWVLLGRAAVLVAATEHQADLDPANRYVTSAAAREWTGLHALLAVPPPLAQEALCLAVGHAPRRPSPVVPRASVPMVEGELVVVDRSVTSLGVSPDAWHDADPHLAVGSVSRHGEGRPAPGPPGVDEPASVSLGAEVRLVRGTAVRAPVAAEVTVIGEDHVVLAVRGAGLDVVVRGVTPTVPVGPTDAGTALGRAARTSIGVVLAPTGVVPPSAIPGSLAPAWLSLCPDPSPLLGLEPGAASASRPDPTSLLERRAAVLAGVQEHYWVSPPMIERGRGAYLYDTDGRAYLDALNNVAVLGHSHPAVEAAVASQLRLLNTNSRFHYEAIVAYAERLASLLPDPLDTVLLVNTGSEACDLALRLIRAATGADDVLAVQGAYHGWTTATDAVSTSLNDNPAALDTRPPWVRLVEAPNTYRGRFRGPDAGERYAADVDRALGDLRTSGRRPAGFIVEPLAGNAGGIVLPDGYLARAFEAVRAAGGLCIADEVQTGLGRLGDWFWAFESQGVVPDVVTVAKATGNGVPVGAVVTTRAIADAFAAQGSFFSSVGGSPVGAVAGLAVLDAIRDEDLQANARTVGAHLRRRLGALVDRHPICGALHGLGLYLGLELVRDRDAHTPAPEEARAVCERARELGVVVQPTGDASNVLKIKPPLCLTITDADLLVDALDRTFTDGW